MLQTRMTVPLLDLKQQWEQIADDVRAAVDDVFATQRFIFGPWQDRLEAGIAQLCGRRHAIAISSGTDALLAALMVLDIGPGDEVITTPFTFFATGGSIARVGARPVFVDICPHCLNIEPANIEPAITPRTRAIMPVHLFGQVAQMNEIRMIADRHGLAIIEDAAQAIGAKHLGQPIGSWGEFAALSFYPTKNLGGAGDGGMLLTDNDELAARVRIIRSHGAATEYHHDVVGANFRLDALQSAVLACKLPHVERWNQQRRDAAQRYDELLSDIPGIQRPDVYPINLGVYHQYTIRVHNGHRDRVKAALTEAGVGAKVFYPVPLHRQPCFAQLGYAGGALPQAESAASEVLSLPMFPEITPDQQAYVAGMLESALR